MVLPCRLGGRSVLWFLYFSCGLQFMRFELDNLLFYDLVPRIRFVLTQHRRKRRNRRHGDLEAGQLIAFAVHSGWGNHGSKRESMITVMAQFGGVVTGTNRKLR